MLFSRCYERVDPSSPDRRTQADIGCSRLPSVQFELASLVYVESYGYKGSCCCASRPILLFLSQFPSLPAPVKCTSFPNLCLKACREGANPLPLLIAALAVQLYWGEG